MIFDEATETLEDIKMDGIRLIQKKKGFRYGMRYSCRSSPM